MSEKEKLEEGVIHILTKHQAVNTRHSTKTPFLSSILFPRVAREIIDYLTAQPTDKEGQNE